MTDRYLFCAVFTIIITSSIIPSNCFLLLDLTASTIQHHKCPCNKEAFTDLRSQITARFC